MLIFFNLPLNDVIRLNYRGLKGFGRGFVFFTYLPEMEQIRQNIKK
jgi:hypothetical protein